MAFGDVASIAAGAVAALRRDWEEIQILARAREFAYEPFKRKLALQLGP